MIRENTSGKKEDIRRSLLLYGGDILNSDSMQSEKNCMQHGSTSVFAHSLSVAFLSLMIAGALRIRVNQRAIVRGALLHDYFLYDWHVPNAGHSLHGFTHAARALKNARRDFALESIEQDIIARHMFPMNPRPPKYRESVIVCIADKLCAACEVAHIKAFAHWL